MRTLLKNLLLVILVGAALYILFEILQRRNPYELPVGETIQVEPPEVGSVSSREPSVETEEDITSSGIQIRRTSQRAILETEGVTHSIPLDEILSGGVGKDGIPSVDDPKFVAIEQARSFIDDETIGLGITIDDESKFYPYSILVWHEIVNDQVAGQPVVVTYCPLCQTGIVFSPVVDGTRYEFGVSGLLFESNLLMYNRTGDAETESLWSQVLGEAVVGPDTGTVLDIIPSATVRFSDWALDHQDGKVLSRQTGATRNYSSDPYINPQLGNYYQEDNENILFGAFAGPGNFSDSRLPAKAFVYGIEIDGKYKAYYDDALAEGLTHDSFAGKEIQIHKSRTQGVRIQTEDGSEVPYIGGFWFSWLSVHPDTDVFSG